MDVKEEDDAQIAKRKAIMTIRRDTSLTPSEQQRRIQEFMATGGVSEDEDDDRSPAFTDATLDKMESAKESNSERPPSVPTTTRQVMMQKVMDDSTLSSQEKQRKISEIMAQPTVSQEPSEVQLQAKQTLDSDNKKMIPTTSRQAQMQAVMSDKTLSLKEKQQRIQAISASSRQSNADVPGSIERKPSAVRTPSLNPRACQLDRDIELKNQIREERLRGSLGSNELLGARASETEALVLDKIARNGPTRVSSKVLDPKVQRLSSRAGASQNQVGGDDFNSSNRVARDTYSDNEVDTVSRAETLISNFDDTVASTSNTADSSFQADTSTPLPVTVAPTLEGAACRGNSREEESTIAGHSENEAIGSSIGAVDTVHISTGREEDSHNASMVPQYADEERIERAPPPPSPPITHFPAARPLSQPQRPLLGSTGPESGGIQAYTVTPDPVAAEKVVTEEELEEEEKRRITRIAKIGVGLLCMLLLVIVIPIAVLVPKGKGVPIELSDSPTSAPSIMPTSLSYATLLSQLETFYDDDEKFTAAFSNPLSHQVLAARWVTDGDPHGLAGDDPRLISRFALAAFYFSLNGDNWIRCGRNSISCPNDEEWLTGPNECDWFGVECVDGFTVDRIFFRPVRAGDNGSNNLNGELPAELSLLPELRSVIMSYQSIRGKIPGAWSQLSNLESLIMNNNQISGTFPDFLFTANSRFSTIHLTGNALTGSLPTDFGSGSLSELRLDGNRLTGSIPDGLGDLSSLSTLHLSNNELSGTVPNTLLSSQLRTLRLSNNTLIGGTLPETIGDATALRQLLIHNCTFEGSLPSLLYSLAELSNLDLGHNSFSGTLSESFAQLSKLAELRLNNNEFVGPIPDAFVGLEFLKEVELTNNRLTGTVSQELCSRKGEGFFNITYLTTDCGSDSAEVKCSCCDNCP